MSDRLSVGFAYLAFRRYAISNETLSMYRRHRYPTIVAMILASTAACGAPASDASAMLAAAEALDDRFLEAFNRANVAGVVATYADSGTVVSIGPDGAILDSRAKIAEGLAATFASMPGARLAFTERHNAVVGNVVVGWGKSQATLPGSDGAAPTVLEGRYSDVKARINGAWVYVSDHVSIPLVAPSSPTSVSDTTK